MYMLWAGYCQWQSLSPKTIIIYVYIVYGSQTFSAKYSKCILNYWILVPSGTINKNQTRTTRKYKWWKQSIYFCYYLFSISEHSVSLYIRKDLWRFENKTKQNSSSVEKGLISSGFPGEIQFEHFGDYSNQSNIWYNRRIKGWMNCLIPVFNLLGIVSCCRDGKIY